MVAWLGEVARRLWARLSRRRLWYAFWAAVLALAFTLLGVEGLLALALFIALDELYVMRRPLRPRDVLGYWDRRCRCWMPSHELLLLATLIAYAALKLLGG